jgi:hypothetical protein
MEVPQVLEQSTLALDEILRYRFNGLMDFKKPARQPLECVAYWEPIIKESVRIREERDATAATWPSISISWHTEDKAARAAADAKMRANAKARIAAEQSAFSQMMHCHTLRTSYSYELAHSLWYNRQAAQNAIGERVREEYRNTYQAEWAAQDVFENQQVEKAIATLKAANPHLPEPTVDKIRRRLKYRLHLFFRRFPRSAAPRRVMRGCPPVLCGSLPSQARLVYPAGHNALIDKAF